MPKYEVYATVKGSKYLGQVEAATKEEAEEKAYDLNTAHISLCHQCHRQCEDPEIDEIVIENAE